MHNQSGIRLDLIMAASLIGGLIIFSISSMAHAGPQQRFTSDDVYKGVISTEEITIPYRIGQNKRIFRNHVVNTPVSNSADDLFVLIAKNKRFIRLSR